MRRRFAIPVLVATLGALLSVGSAAAQVIELQGAWLIDGYTFEPGDRSPRGTIAYHAETNSFSGTYVGVKLPADRPELHALLYDTRTKKALHLGRVDYKAGTIGKDKGAFNLALPAAVSDGNFKPFEVVAFSAEVDTRDVRSGQRRVQVERGPLCRLDLASAGKDGFAPAIPALHAHLSQSPGRGRSLRCDPVLGR